MLNFLFALGSATISSELFSHCYFNEVLGILPVFSPLARAILRYVGQNGRVNEGETERRDDGNAEDGDGNGDSSTTIGCEAKP